jgi:hypothetical protein
MTWTAGWPPLRLAGVFCRHQLVCSALHLVAGFPGTQVCLAADAFIAAFMSCACADVHTKVVPYMAETYRHCVATCFCAWPTRASAGAALLR